MSRTMRAGLWASRFFIVLAVVFGVVVAHLSLAVLALALVALPSTVVAEIPYGRGPLLHAVSAALELFTTVAIAVVLVLEHDQLPIVLTVIAAGWAAYCILPAVVDLIPTFRADLRAKSYERRVQRGFPTSTL